MQLSFEKYQGIGNDFIVCRVDSERPFDTELVRRLCDRHFGIGADGVLLVSPAADARARMIVLNADGSRPEMCGNGLRCVALAVATEDAPTDEFVVLTDAGPRLCQLARDGAAGAQVSTQLGSAERVGTISHPVLSAELEFVRISVGNPHAIAFTEQIPPEELDRVGASLSARIAGGTNVEIATLRPDGSIDLAVWERGVGRTLACGTGAGATAAAAVALGLVPAERPTEIRLPGGALELRVARDLTVTLRGPARRVFAGAVEI